MRLLFIVICKGSASHLSLSLSLSAERAFFLLRERIPPSVILYRNISPIVSSIVNPIVKNGAFGLRHPPLISRTMLDLVTLPNPTINQIILHPCINRIRTISYKNITNHKLTYSF
jgi:hypothetical protein